MQMYIIVFMVNRKIIVIYKNYYQKKSFGCIFQIQIHIQSFISDCKHPYKLNTALNENQIKLQLILK